MDVSAAVVDTLWKQAEAFGDAKRPELYSAGADTEDDFAPLTDPEEFIQDLDILSHAKLYALAANGQLALKAAQDEFLDLENAVKQMKAKDSVSDPQALDEPDVYNEKKEAALYGYKYQPSKPALMFTGRVGQHHEPSMITEQEKSDVRLMPDAFAQGGFYPTKWKKQDFQKAQYRAANQNNIDGWKPLLSDGKKLVPRPNPRKSMADEEIEMNEENKRRVDAYRRKRAMKDEAEDTGDDSRPSTASSHDPSATPSRKLDDKRLTRFRGTKHPPTRDVSEAPSATSTPRKRRHPTPKLESPRTPELMDTPTSKRRKLNSATLFPVELPDGPSPAQLKAKANIGLTADELLTKHWAPDELVETVKLHHAWLNADPEKALEWKNKIINGKFPARTWAMFKKWREWKSTGRGKRPRKGKAESNAGTPLPELKEEKVKDSPGVLGLPEESFEEREGREEKREHLSGELRPPEAIEGSRTAASNSPYTPGRRSTRRVRRASN